MVDPKFRHGCQQQHGGIILQPILCSISEAAKALGLGRSKTYELIAAGQLETVSIGRRRLIRIESVKAFAENLEV
ncbi:helix-turn-helix domain-containing protein [Emcibacter sp. SYSU 3D8]|uniref:helix-turn-helix domain-containing protein n=1 Tax=Emcibacter sp. SYSU 3D8 TaxID=3133969 RepID=UPI0031FED640